MLIYESEGFLEVEAKNIRQLCRSTASVTLDDTKGDSTTLYAALCDYLDDSEPRCCIAFYSKPLKRAFVFAVKGSERQSPWQCGQNALVQLDFRLEDVNLKLSPAMQEVVLRDVPGLLSPTEARKQRTENESFLAECQNAFDEAPDSPQGKKALLKLNAEKRYTAQAEEVRHLLVELFSSKESVSDEQEALLSQVNNLTSRLENATALAESERNQREMSESITSAAEKRIQELEEILVDAETTSSKTTKQKQKNVQLQARIKKLNGELEVALAENAIERDKHEQLNADMNAAHEQISLLENDLKKAEVTRINVLNQLEEAQVEIAKEREKQEQSIADVNAAHEQISLLENDLKKAEVTRINVLNQLEEAQVEIAKEREKQEQSIADVNAARGQISLLENDLKKAEVTRINILTQLEEVQAENAQLAESFQEVELHIKTLNSELGKAETQAADHAESVHLTEKSHAQLADVQMALRNSLEINSVLEEQLTGANAQNNGLLERLEAAEKKANDNARLETQVDALSAQNDQLGGDVESLRAEYDQEHIIRERLEKAAIDKDKRIKELENSLALMSQSVSDEKDSKEDDQRLASLQGELQELKQLFREEQKCREGLESEVDEAHKLVDSLEKMVRETEAAAPEQRSHESENQMVQELAKKLMVVEMQLEHERIEQKKHIKAVVVAEHKLAKHEEQLAQGQVVQIEKKIQETSVIETAAQQSSKPMPHDLRPAPKKGSFFHPDWDLEGLPCQSSDQIFKAWETAFNVQISLEGYPSQYCMAYLVVLRQKKQKKLYMLYRLKLTKHTLVCVPSKMPHDEASLKKTIKEGLNFLKMSGFHMEEISMENVDSTLKSYFLED